MSLRAATADAHARLDKQAGSAPMSDRAAYGRFLLAQAKPLFALEAALEARGVERFIPDWPQRTRRAALTEDLRTLGLPAPTPASVDIPSEPHAWGTLYVFEGSRLGARFILKHLGQPESTTHFLRHGEGSTLWPVFLAQLEAAIETHALPACIDGAHHAFALFEESFAKSLRAPAVAPVPAE